MSGEPRSVPRRAVFACPWIRRPTQRSCIGCCISSIRKTGRGSRWSFRRMRPTGRPFATGLQEQRDGRIHQMLQPVKSGRELVEEIDRTLSVTPTLWWLGHAGFIVRFANITFYVDPCLSDPPGRKRRIAAPLAAHEIRNADMV